ncbi:MAG: isoamylase early set domain-containing protein [Spirochaetales bacterium]|nr:isoamylase early set domain-containing protein [Spirochaetales bacterium]
MECDKVRKIIYEYHNLKLTVPEIYREHLDNCISCRTFKKSLDMVEGCGEFNLPVIEGLEEKCLRGVDSLRADSRGFFINRTLLAAAAVLLVVFTVSITLMAVGNIEKSVVVYLQFYAPEAKEVAVVGDWNNWNPALDILQDKDGDGRWEIRIKVRTGREYRYQFLIDGEQWVPDPDAPISLNDGFGGENSILNI